MSTEEINTVFYAFYIADLDKWGLYSSFDIPIVPRAVFDTEDEARVAARAAEDERNIKVAINMGIK